MPQYLTETVRFAGKLAPGAQSTPADDESAAGNALELLQPGHLTWSDDPQVLQQQIARLDQLATEYVLDQRPENTKRAYADDYRVWCLFCDGLGVSPRTVSPGLLVAFTVWLERGREHPDPVRRVAACAPSTIRRRLYGTVVELRQRGVDVPAGATKLANENIKAFERRLARDNEQRGRGKAAALTIKQIRALCREFGDSLPDLRDRALLLIGFAIAARRSELAHLDVTDIVDDPNGLIVSVRHSKTGAREVVVPYGTRESTCPVRAWHAWKTAADLTDGKAFRSIDRWGNLGPGMTGKYVGRAITAAGERAGLMIRFTGHSVRAGLATEARRAGHDVHAIAKQGGWSPNSTVLFGYMQIVDRWTDNALNGIGL